MECSGYGDCLEDNSGEWTCECEDGYYGDACDQKCPGLVIINNSTVECSGNGICSEDKSHEWRCECDDGYHGDDCNETCPGFLNIDGTIIECNGHGTCDEQTMKCLCSSDHYTGDGCECSENTCGNHGKCNDQMKCECDSEQG